MKFGCYDIQSGGVRRQEKFALSLVGMKLVKTRCCFSPIFYRAQMQHWHLNDAAALHHDDFVRLLHRRQPVRDHDGGPPPPAAGPVSDELIQRLLHHLFAVRVQGLPKPTPPVRLSAAETLVSKCKPERILGDSRQCCGASSRAEGCCGRWGWGRGTDRGGLVQEQQRRVPQDGPRDGNALLLPPRQLAAPRAAMRSVPASICPAMGQYQDTALLFQTNAAQIVP